MVLFGHQTGNPNSHQAAFALLESGFLGAYCTPWYPSGWEIEIFKKIPGCQANADRFTRRSFAPLKGVPKIQGRLEEFRRLAIRSIGKGHEGLSYEVNDWMMRTLSKEIQSGKFRAIYTYEDCAEAPFLNAKKLRKACIYDMPIAYYGWWQKKEAELAKKYRDWLPPEGISSSRWVRPEQKRKEMELADLVLVPSQFVANSIREFLDKNIQVASYGTEIEKNQKLNKSFHERPLRFLFVSTASIRKGTPLLLETWRKLGWRNAELLLAGSWQLARPISKILPPGARYLGQLPRQQLLKFFREVDYLVHPSNHEGFSLAILEALGHGLPVLASTATGAADLPKSEAVRLFEPENPEQLAEVLIQAKEDRNKDLSQEARRIAVGCSWKAYREKVREAVGPLLD